MVKGDDIFVRVGMKREPKKKSGSKKISNNKIRPKEEKRKVKSKLKKLEKKSRFKLFHAQAVFPFNLFPDSITIYTNKIVVVHRYLLSSQSFPVLIEDVKTARDYRGIIYARLNIEIAGFEQNPPPIKWLTVNDAATARKYILALLEANREGVDLEYLSKEECINYLDRVGEALVVSEDT